MTENLILSGGIYHPFEETSARAAELLAGAGIRSEIRGVADGLALLRERQFDIVTVNALAFSMTQAEKYAPLRERHAFTPSEADRGALRDHARRGGALLGLHTAAICFDGWAEWPDMLGAGWVWGRSHHPAPDYVTVTGPDGDAEIWDELYCDLQIAEDARVVATATCEGIAPQPILLTRERSAYLGLGHDLTGMAAPGYAPLLRRAAGLALGRERIAA